jgi:hypothetical protein
MFESVQQDDAAARFRAAAVFPLIAILLTLLYLTIYPLLARVPAALFWSVVAVLVLGTAAGAAALVRTGRPRGAAVAWFIGSILVELVCARMLLWFTLPWL